MKPMEHYLLFKLQQAISLGGLYLILLLALIASAELAGWVGRRSGERGDNGKDASTLASAALGLLALLIAFTYSMAVQRYDLRRQAVLEEANAIGSTANFALMLPHAAQAPIIDLLRQYIQVRIGLGVPFNTAKFGEDIATSTRLQTALWQQAVAVSAAAPQSLPAYRFVASLNEVNNIGEKRLTGLRNHVPVVITLMLIGTAMVAMGFTGYSSGVAGVKRRLAQIVMSLTVALLITLTIDLQRPDRGTIEVPSQPLVDALQALPAP